MAATSDSPSVSGSVYARAYADHERYLWGLLYRLTGSAADADDLLQETFVRALERPPADVDRPLRPWLVRVAVNLGRDHLRRRRRSPYPGAWLPSPVATDRLATVPGGTGAGTLDEAPAGEGDGADARYGRLESISYAFLVALEALTPQQRAVLLLRDVFDYSVRETAGALGLSEPNVKTTHHRARKAISGYDDTRELPSSALQARTRRVLESFVAAVVAGDVAGVERLLAADVRADSDSGGEFVAALNPIVGSNDIARFFVGISKMRPPGTRIELRSLNGQAALVVEGAWATSGPLAGRLAPRLVTCFETRSDGRVAAIHSVLASRKLVAAGFD